MGRSTADRTLLGLRLLAEAAEAVLAVAKEEMEGISISGLSILGLFLLYMVEGTGTPDQLMCLKSTSAMFLPTVVTLPRKTTADKFSSCQYPLTAFP